MGKNSEEDPSNSKELAEKKKHEYEFAIARLREIKNALKYSSDITEIRRLLAEFGGIASELPSGSIPPDVSSDTIKEVYSDAVSHVNSMTQGISDQDFNSKEKAYEQEMKGFNSVTKEIEDFLDRDDIKASSKRNSRWADSPETMTSKDAELFAESHAKEKEEEQGLVRKVLETPAEEVIKRMDERRKSLVEFHGFEHHDEVRKHDDECHEHLHKHVESIGKLSKRHQDKASIFGSTAVKEELGVDKAKAEQEICAAKGAALQNKQSKFAKKLEELKAKKIANKVQVETSRKLSPDSTPNRLVPSLKRGKI